MANNVTKILFRRGTDAERRGVTFSLAEPAYSTDTRRLFIGDGITAGGIPLGMRNYGFVNSLSGTYLNSGLSVTSFQLLSAAMVGDIVYDRATSNIWALTGNTFGTPALSNFAQYPVVSDINPSQFFYDGTRLNLVGNSIGPNQISTSLVGAGLSGGNGAPISIASDAVSNQFLAKMPANSVKANTTNSIGDPVDLAVISTNQVVGRGSGTLGAITLSATGSTSISSNNNTIVFRSTVPLPLAGGTMTGAIDARPNGVLVPNIPAGNNYAVNKYWVENLPCFGTLQDAFSFIGSQFLALTGGTLTGPLYTTNTIPIYWGNANTRTETKNNAGTQASKSGFFETSTPVNYYGGATSWQHLIEARHSNDTNNYALQIAGSFFDQNLYFRKTNNSSTTTWSRIVAQDGSNNINITSGDLNFASSGQVGIGRNAGSYKLDVAGDIISDNWLRTRGTAGWYSETYGGGWRMTDSTWIRAYNGKSVWVGDGILGGDAGLTIGYGGTFGAGDGGVNIAGSVGIGTAGDPVAKLDVRGDIYTSGSVRGGSNWNRQTGNYSIQDSDVGGTVAIDSGANLFVTVPSNSFRAGFQVNIIRLNAGNVTINGGGGVNIRQSYGHYRLAAQWSTATLIYSGNPSTGWILFGDLIP